MHMYCSFYVINNKPFLIHMHALQLSMLSSAVAEQVLDHCIVESADNNVHEDTNYSVVYNYEFLEDVHEGSGST